MDSIIPWLDQWAATNIKYPLLAVFFATLLFAYGIYQIIMVGFGQRHQRARMKLAELRVEGTILRNEGMNLSNTLALDRWVGKTTNWVDRVSKEISKIDKADSLQFSHLGYPGQPRPHPGINFFSGAHEHSFFLHDIFEQRLERYLIKYSKLENELT
jgi:hypothetical protein